MQKIYLRILPKKIGWFKFILEGYDGLAVLTTVDRTIGLVSVSFHSSSTGEFFSLLAALSGDLSPYESSDATKN
jgi:hypothetical protein